MYIANLQFSSNFKWLRIYVRSSWSHVAFYIWGLITLSALPDSTKIDYYISFRPIRTKSDLLAQIPPFSTSVKVM